MCFGMVLFMSNYNLYINGAFGHITVAEALTGSFIGFIIAMLLDLYLVGPIAKKITFKLVGKKDSMVLTIMTMSVTMIFGMVFFMSIYGLVTNYLQGNLSSGSILEQYFAIFGNNFIVALPLQVIVVAPIVRFIFNKFIKNSSNEPALTE